MSLNRILVPTDFSPCADAAWETAMAIAERQGTVLDLWHTMDWPSAEGLPEGEGSTRFEQAQQALRKRLADAEARKLEAYQHLTWPRFSEGFAEWVERPDLDLVCMGTHGVQGVREWMYGSQTQRAVRMAKQPVLALQKALQKPIRKVLFLTDLDQEAAAVFLAVHRVLTPEEPEYHSLHVQLPRLFHEPLLVLRDARKRFLEALPVPVQEHQFPELSLERAVDRIQSEVDIDLVALGTHGKGHWSRAFRYSLTEALINHGSLPVLAVPLDT
jgi:nucleotide-binding universal stress UspA family protein